MLIEVGICNIRVWSFVVFLSCGVEPGKIFSLKQLVLVGNRKTFQPLSSQAIRKNMLTSVEFGFLPHYT